MPLNNTVKMIPTKIKVRNVSLKPTFQRVPGESGERAIMVLVSVQVDKKALTRLRQHPRIIDLQQCV